VCPSRRTPGWHPGPFLTVCRAGAGEQKYAFSGSGDVCATLIEKVPCDGAGGAWTHVCKASVSVTCNGFIYMVETSRQLPDHVAAMVIPAEHTEASLGGWPLEQQHIVRPLGLSLGLGLLTLGRFLYNPCLFYLPAVLLGCTVIQQMSPYLRAEMGLSHHMITMVGALLGIVLACLQRHVVVWMFGALLGVLAFFGLSSPLSPSSPPALPPYPRPWCLLLC